MAYKVGSLSNLISGLGGGTNETIIFKKKNTQEGSSAIFKKPEKCESTHTRKRKQSTRRSKEAINETVSEEEDSTDVIDESCTLLTSNVSTNSNNAVRRIQSKQENVDKETFRDAEAESRTIFVKNLPHSLDKKKIKKVFKNFGNIESVRLRCAAVEDIGMTKRFAVIKNKFHEERSTICAFIRFCHKEDALSALDANGTVVQDHHIFVDKADNPHQHNRRKSVFLGNVPFSAEEEDVWTVFETCGKILNIRIIRDAKTGIGKGFAYVAFANTDAVELALSLNGTHLKDRPLRVSRVVQKKKLSFHNLPLGISRVVRKKKPSSHHHSSKVTQHSVEEFSQIAGIRGNATIKQGRQKEEQSGGNAVSRSKFSELSPGKSNQAKQKKKYMPFQGQMTQDRKQKKKQKINKMEQRKKIIALKLKHKGSEKSNEKKLSV